MSNNQCNVFFTVVPKILIFIQLIIIQKIINCWKGWQPYAFTYPLNLNRKRKKKLLQMRIWILDFFIIKIKPCDQQFVIISSRCSIIYQPSGIVERSFWKFQAAFCFHRRKVLLSIIYWPPKYKYLHNVRETRLAWDIKYRVLLKTLIIRSRI